MKKVVLLSLVVWFWNGTLLSAQPAEGKERTVDFMLDQKGFMENYLNMRVKSMTEEYSLTPEQTKKVRTFITKEDVRTLFKTAGKMEKFDRDMRRMVKKQNLTPQDLQKVREGSEQLYPLCRNTLKSMMLQTLKVHSILTDEQKKAHQKELDEIEMNTAELTSRLERWKEGKIEIDELRECFTVKEPTEAEKGPPGGASALITYSDASLDFWELFVKTFIDAFELDKGQRTMAYSVLGDIRPKAQAYRKDHAEEYAALRNQILSLRGGGRTSDTPEGKTVAEILAENNKRAQELDKPLMEMFEELKQRLMKIPTEPQRQRALDLLEKPESPKKTGK